MAIWYHSGRKPVTIRWVFARVDDKLTSLVSNDTLLEAYQMIAHFTSHRQTARWSAETTFGLILAHLTRPGDTKNFDRMRLGGIQRDVQSKLPWISSTQDKDQL